MKNKFSVFGMLAIVLALGLVLAGCATNGSDESNTDPKTIVITGFNLQGKTRILVYQVSSITNMDLDNDPSVVFGNIGDANGLNGDVTIERYLRINGERIPWTGTGKFEIYLQVEPANNGKGRSAYFYSVDGVNPAQVDFKNKVTTLEWSKFVYLREDANAG